MSHVNPEFFAFKDLLARGEASPYRRWFQVLRFPVVIDPERPAFRHYPKGPHLPMLDTSCPEVVAFLEEYVRRWTRSGIDGWRLDAVADRGPGIPEDALRRPRLGLLGARLLRTGLARRAVWTPGEAAYWIRSIGSLKLLNACPSRLA